MLPTVFVSHGSPMLALADTPAASFLRSFGATLPRPRPRAILAVSAHFETGRPTVSRAAAPGMIYDFRGFPPALSEIVYAAPGSPETAGEVAAALSEAGLAAELSERGFDHGTWVPLSLLSPGADIPVVTMSIQPDAGPAHHYRIGQALRALPARGILVLASGSLTHNLWEMDRGDVDAEAREWAKAFADWVDARLAEGDVAALLDYSSRAPHAERNHPTDEHLLPLFVALGAAGEGASARRVHTSHEYGALMMDAYAFTPAAA
jgi:4,5-DOPA dioxygenase extradiol